MRVRPNNDRAKVVHLAVRAFTLLEMLVVLIIIALIATLALPHIRGNQESVAINAACRQFIEDLSYARQRAMSIRGTVAVVFIPSDILQSQILNLNALSPEEKVAVKQLQGGVYTHYALYQYRAVGEQPGSYKSSGYITEWKSLPDKTFFLQSDLTGALFNNAAKFPFPFSGNARVPRSANFPLPYLAFDSQGRCIYVDRDETGAGQPVRDMDIHIARGSIFYSRDASTGVVDPNTLDVQQIPPYNATNNTIHIDFLTGRAQRIELQLQ